MTVSEALETPGLAVAVHSAANLPAPEPLVDLAERSAAAVATAVVLAAAHPNLPPLPSLPRPVAGADLAAEVEAADSVAVAALAVVPVVEVVAADLVVEVVSLAAPLAVPMVAALAVAVPSEAAVGAAGSAVTNKRPAQHHKRPSLTIHIKKDVLSI